MKKLLLWCVIAAAAVLTSCEKQINRQQVIGDIFIEEVVSDNGSGYKLVLSSDGVFSPVSDLVYSKVVYEEGAKLIMAYNGDGFQVFNLEGQRRGSGDCEYKKIDVQGDLVYLTDANDKISLYLPEKGSIFGPYFNILVTGDKIFALGPKGWGLLDTNYNYLQDMVYEKLYIVNQNDKKYDVMRYRDGAWSMATSDGAEYDEDSVKAAVKLLEKKFKPDAPIGVIPMSM